MCELICSEPLSDVFMSPLCRQGESQVAVEGGRGGGERQIGTETLASSPLSLILGYTE